MARSTLVAGGVLALVLLSSVQSEEAYVVPRLSAVTGMEHFRGPPSARALLRRNGFVVVPAFRHRIFSPYFETPLPRYVTADSVHRTFHVILEDEIKRMETAFAGKVARITTALAARFRRMRTGPENPEAL